MNKFLAQAGVCSRREADQLIAAGEVKVNGKIVTELGTKVVPREDKVVFRGKLLQAEQYVYFLLNKPKNMITTTKDPEGRKTVIDLVGPSTDARIFPVGRLDRNTTGLLLLTNDGALAEKLTHPSYRIRKLYHVRLNKDVPQEDLEALMNGVALEDGLAKADLIDYVVGKGANEVGIEIHSGRNRIVRRMFEHLGYRVDGLDRVAIGHHLTKKRLPRGKWRPLTDKEVGFLKMV
ncbi:MAG: pseudouridine synthase [Bacteroidota bacterium]